jgi:hypothetical protein
MPCKNYKNALMEAAASGFHPQGDVRAHMDACASCRAAFEQEQSLFASIDVGLQVSANAEVPASLLQRVRACLDEASAPRRIGVPNWLVFASAAVMVVAIVAAHSVWRTRVVEKPVETAVKTIVQPRQNHDPSVGHLAENDSPSHRELAFARNPSPHEPLVRGKTTPEVVVPRDQELLLAEYAEQWSLRKHAPLGAQDSDATVLAPLQMDQIQIAELDVKLLAEEKSQ